MTFDLILALFRVKKGLKNGPHGPYLSHTWKYPWYAWTKFRGPVDKTFLENGQNPPKFSIFTYFLSSEIN